MFTSPWVLHVTCHFMCHVSCVTCHMSHVKKKNRIIGRACQWRVCYQKGITHWVLWKKWRLETFFEVAGFCEQPNVIMVDLGKPSWGKNCFCLDLDHFAMTPSLWYLSILLNRCYLLVPCDKTIWRLRLRLSTNRSVTSVNTNLLKRKKLKRHMLRNHKSPPEERERSGVPMWWVWI